MIQEAITDSAGLNGPVVEIPKPRKRTTKRVGAESNVVSNVIIEEAKETSSDEGQVVITGPKQNRSSRKSNSFTTDTGAIGSRSADNALNKKVDTTVNERVDDSAKVAIWSNKNIRWTGVGSLSKGYNIVKKEEADVWLAREGIREATPEEVASYYGK